MPLGWIFYEETSLDLSGPPGSNHGDRHITPIAFHKQIKGPRVNEGDVVPCRASSHQNKKGREKQLSQPCIIIHTPSFKVVYIDHSVLFVNRYVGI